MTLPTAKRLILVTNCYPFNHGDVGFVQREIDALAAAYSEVAIFVTQAAPGLTAVPMPSNAYVVSVSRGLGEVLRKGARKPCWEASSLLRVIRQDLRRIRRLSHVKTLAMSLLQGRGVAQEIAKFTTRNSVWLEADIYFFWGAWGAYAIPWLDVKRGNLVVRMHGGDLYEDRHDGYLPMRHIIMSGADLILAVSEHGATYLRNAHPTISRKIRVARLGSLDHGLNSGPTSGRKLNVVSCSNIVPVKQVPKIAEAIRELGLRGLEVSWTHFGEGEELNHVRSVVSKMPSTVAVDLRGSVPHREVMNHLSTASVSVFVNASSSEGSPVSVMEALSFDIPVVVPPVGGVPEMLGSTTEVGVILPHDWSHSDLADALRQAAAYRDRAPGIRRARWESDFRSDVNAARVARLIQGFPS